MFKRVCVCLFLSTLKSTALELGMSELQNVKLFNNAKGQDGSATISSWASACVSPSALHAWWWFKPNSGRKSQSLAVAIFSGLFLAPHSRYSPAVKEQSGNTVTCPRRIFRCTRITNTTTVWLRGSPLTPRLLLQLFYLLLGKEQSVVGLRKYSLLHTSTLPDNFLFSEHKSRFKECRPVATKR